jgi:hypothetical protein
MIVTIDMDRYGWVTIQPVSKRMARRFKGKTIFLQDPTDFLDNLPKGKVKSIQSGWTERIRMDEWEYKVCVGDDD